MQLKNNTLLKNKAFINGEWLAGKKEFNVINPFDNSVITSVPDLGAQATTKAIESAAAAFRVWGKTAAKQRSTILLEWYKLIIQNIDDLAKILVAEQGKPVTEAKKEIFYGASFVQWFAEQAKRIYGKVMMDYASDTTLQYTKEPVGVVGIITPWNFPMALVTRKVATAFACGCTVVVKPSEYTPLCTLVLAELATQAGIPAGVFNVVTTNNAAEVGSVLTKSKIVKKISFTGSTRVGKLLLAQSASTIKKLSLELGGNAPFIVFDDANLKNAVEALIAAKFRNAGQTCVCANRIFLQAKIHDDFVLALKQKIAEFKVGNGLESDVTQGPLINQQAIEKVKKHISLAVADGAKIVVGGKPHSLGGLFFQATILTAIKNKSIFWEEETFGPVAPIIKFETEAEVLEMANNTDYGLAAYFCTQDFRRIERMNRALEAGIIGVNLGIISNEFGPFGGVKQSGLGKEGSELGIEEYLEIKYTAISYK